MGFKFISFADLMFWIPGPSQPYPTLGALGKRLSKNSNDSGSNSVVCPWLDFYAHCLLLSAMWKRLENICEDFKLWKQSFPSNLFSLKLDLLQSPRVFNFSAMHSNAMCGNTAASSIIPFYFFWKANMSIYVAHINLWCALEILGTTLAV